MRNTEMEMISKSYAVIDKSKRIYPFRNVSFISQKPLQYHRHP